ncbi:MAG: asparagine--tRNA ligase [Candidatus Bathyarchaeota archaeon]|jgi:asparaginyl-tRNA synthetase|nr:asparagine--tRNA ligase [Candidatus Bathyarchaeota archaeon]
MSFTPVGEVLTGKFENKRVSIRGWVYRKRESRRTIFLLLRDSSGVIQSTVKQGTRAWESAKKITIESSTSLSGIVKKDKRAPSGYEISTDEMTIIGLAETFPIAKDLSEGFLRDVRHLWLRSRKMNLVMRVRSFVLQHMHEFLREKGFTEISPPMFITSACEGGATLFSAKYFDRDLYLTQSAQLYSEVLIFSLEKVYTCAPSFRAEKSRTIRHLTEYWHVEPEWAFADMNDVMQIEEELISYVCRKSVECCKRELEELGVDQKRLSNIKPPFLRMTYDEAIDKLQNKGQNIQWGEDLGYDEEKSLAEGFEKPFFVYDYPKKIKAFYCKTYRDRPDIAMSVDMLVPRVGELATGGAREDDKDELLKRVSESGLQLTDYEWYVDLRRYGTVPHAGFGIGVERVLMWMLDLDNIIDAIPFPRTMRRSYP